MSCKNGIKDKIFMRETAQGLKELFYEFSRKLESFEVLW